MKHYRLKNNQQHAGGFTDLFVLTHADLTETTDNTAQAIVLTALDIGDVVFPNMLLEVVTNASGGSVSTCTGSVGVTGALTQFIGNSNLLSAGNEYFAPANTVAPYVCVAGSINVEANFIPDSGHDLEDLTAGEFWVWACISRSGERALVKQAA